MSTTIHLVRTSARDQAPLYAAVSKKVRDALAPHRFQTVTATLTSHPSATVGALLARTPIAEVPGVAASVAAWLDALLADRDKDASEHRAALDVRYQTDSKGLSDSERKALKARLDDAHKRFLAHHDGFLSLVGKEDTKGLKAIYVDPAMPGLAFSRAQIDRLTSTARARFHEVDRGVSEAEVLRRAGVAKVDALAEANSRVAKARAALIAAGMTEAQADAALA